MGSDQKYLINRINKQEIEKRTLNAFCRYKICISWERWKRKHKHLVLEVNGRMT